MNGKVHSKLPRANSAANRQQALFVRAVVGSLVLCAALAPNTLAQGVVQGTFRKDDAPEVKAFRPVYAPPFRALLAKTRRMIEAGELGAQDTFDFTLEADRNANGTLSDVSFTSAQASNKSWQPLVSEFINALSDSRALRSLEDVKHLSITLRLDERASVGLNAAVASEERAAQLAQGYNALVALGRMQQRGRDGVEILNNMAFNANGKQLAMQLELSREQVGNLLRQQLSLP
jgi:hypothetical protein